MSGIQSAIAYDAFFSFNCGCEKYFGKSPKFTPGKINVMKIASYIPIVNLIVWGLFLQGINEEVQKKPHLDNDPLIKAFRARAYISMTIVGGLLLAIVDLFSTILVKPFIACAAAAREKAWEKREIEKLQKAPQ